MEPNGQLRAAREATPSPHVSGARMSRQELAESVNAWCVAHTQRAGALDEHYIGRLEQGRVRCPGRDYRAAFRAILARSDEELGFVPHRAPLTSEFDPDGVLMPADQERLSKAAVRPARTDRAAVDAVASVLAGLRRLEDETSTAAVLPSVLDQRQLAERLAAGASDGTQAQAVGLASEISQYLGWLAIPLGRWTESRHHLDRAAVLALEVDDPLRLATALSFQAYAALRTGDYRRADALSEASARDARVDAGLRTYLAFQRAEVLARSGDRTGAVRLLVDADRLVEALPPSEELTASGYWSTPAFFLGQRGFVLNALGDTQAARQAARDCLAAMPPEWAASEWAIRRRELAEV
jgi:hypothetical protein